MIIVAALLLVVILTIIVIVIVIIIVIVVVTLLHPVSITRFPSFRTQTLANLSDLCKNGFLSNPDPGENLVSGYLVMETGCTTD